MFFLRCSFLLIFTCVLSFKPISTLAQLQDRDLLWGPYRSNLYFGLRARVPKGISFGLMWAGIEDELIDDKRLRHTLEDDDNEILRYNGWDYYDVRLGGMSKVTDLRNEMNLSMEFLKYDVNGIKGSWTARITANSWYRSGQARTIFYVAPEHSSNIVCNSSKNSNQHDKFLSFSGSQSGLGSFSIVMDPNTELQHDIVVHSLKVPEDTLWMAKGIPQIHAFDRHEAFAV